MNAAMATAIAPFSGGLLNPARAFGPLFMMSQLASNDQLLMTITPFVGCWAAMWIYKKGLISEDLEDELDEL